MRPELPGVLEEAAREEGLPAPPPRPSPRVGSQALCGTAQRQGSVQGPAAEFPHVLPPCPPDCGTENPHHPPRCALAPTRKCHVLFKPACDVRHTCRHTPRLQGSSGGRGSGPVSFFLVFLGNIWCCSGFGHNRDIILTGLNLKAVERQVGGDVTWGSLNP